MPDLRSIGRMLPIPASLRSFLGRRLNLGRVAASQSAPDATPSNVAPGPVAASSPGSWADGAPSPWAAPTSAELAAGAWCPICRWTGAAFEGVSHSESALCPRCGSIARDRFLFWSFVHASGDRPALGAAVLETSPRLGEDYRRAMASWFAYRCSDYDERAYRGVLRIDLQAIDLPDGSLDVLLSPHVLEHVPDTGRALGEMFRVLAPGGRLYLQVPVLQGFTAPPTEPEFHGDNTPVFWRFGYDLTDRLAASGFEVRVLVPAGWRALAESGATSWPNGEVSPEFDVASMLDGCRHRASELEPVLSEAEARRLGLEPAYMFLTWECRKPALVS